jgi:hypothetical protein
MMQSCASAAKLRSGGPILPVGAKAKGHAGIPARRRNGEVIGYVLGTSLDVKAHIPILRAMLRVFPSLPDCYLYGPVCIAESERGKGLAGGDVQRIAGSHGWPPSYAIHTSRQRVFAASA